MLETITLFLFTWYGISLLFILSFLLFNMASFLSFMLICASGYLLYAKLGQELSLWLIAGTIVGYFAIGATWSFFRYKRFIAERIAYNKKNDYVFDKHFIQSLAPTENAYDIFIWISVWPVSMVENLMNDVTEYVMSLFSGVYKRIYEGAIKDLIVPPKE